MGHPRRGAAPLRASPHILLRVAGPVPSPQRPSKTGRLGTLVGNVDGATRKPVVGTMNHQAKIRRLVALAVGRLRGLQQRPDRALARGRVDWRQGAGGLETGRASGTRVMKWP